MIKAIVFDIGGILIAAYCFFDKKNPPLMSTLSMTGNLKSFRTAVST